MASRLLNVPDCAADEAMVGLLAAQPSLASLDGHRVVVRRDLASWRRLGRPALVSAAAAGHGPCPAGLVGAGLLTAAAVGGPLTPPPAHSIAAAMRAVATPAGLLALAMDYPADRRRFGLAAERLRAEGVQVEVVFVSDDRGAAAGRGHAGITLACKLVGEAAETSGRTLDDLAAIARHVTAGLGTVALALAPCTRPGGDATFQLPDGMMELGVGARGEPGARRVSACSSQEAVKLMLDHMTRADAPARFELPSQCVLLVNSLGGLSDIELLVTARDAARELSARGVTVQRLLAGTLFTCLAEPAVSLTVLPLLDGHLPGRLVLQWLDAPAAAPGWRDTIHPDSFAEPQLIESPGPPAELESAETAAEPPLPESDACRVTRCLEFAARALVACAGQLDELDRGAGDGDCGSTLSSLGRLVLERLPALPTDRPRLLLTQLADICETIGGTSGVLYALSAAAAARGWSGGGYWPWVAALQYGLDAVRRYGGAQRGDRTLLDAAEPALQAAERAAAAGQPAAAVAQAAAEAAERGALMTAGMAAAAGRASYVSSDLLTRADPGAHAVGVWMRAVAEALKLH